MCGIAGVLRFDPSARVELAALQAMADTIAHRGPDDEGYFVDGNVGLAHRRLSIIDLAGGAQPLFNEDRSVVVVLNGEIYNYAELTERLAQRGHRFRSASDTEVIVHGYEERREEVVEDLRGMFAFALWDRRRRRLLLARDRLGIKPLYYHLSPRHLAFASEIKALLELPDVPREIDPEALDLYLSLRYVPGPRTLFRGIRKLEPGHLLVWDAKGLRSRRYWDLPRGEEATGDSVHPFAEQLAESVRLHLVSDVPLGIFLSGGLDSTSILAMAGEVDPRPYKTFTVGYEPISSEAREANEFTYARLAAESFRAEHRELTLADVDFQDWIADLVWHLDEPLADPACVPLFFISRLARRDITVVLSGEGADEILGGYTMYRRMLGFERIHRLAPGSLAKLAPLVAGWAPEGRMSRAVRLLGQPLQSRFRGVSRAFFPELKAELLGRDGTGDGSSLVDEVFDRHFAAIAGAPPLEQMLYVDTKTWLADELLAKADKMTMANSQELRVPFLDHRLVEFAARLPPSAKVRAGSGKVLLREAMDGRVPEAIIDRTKKGFPVPVASLLRRLGGFTRDLLLDPRSACTSCFDPAVIGRLLDEHERGTVRREHELWSLLVFELWHGLFIDRRFQPARRP
ncbi:MAG TPA: asparagine synthase (glutamine-hydrolyzing), partial [Thermoanaerobaculia bacterium]